MEELLLLLKDGKSRSVELLAAELSTTKEDVLRRLEFLEHAGKIHRVLNAHGCQNKGCSACGASGGKKGKKQCGGCLPQGGFKHMGEIWEVVGA